MPAFEFSGNYLASKSDPLGAFDSKTVEGTVPKTYETRGYLITCTFTKKSADDKLLKV